MELREFFEEYPEVAIAFSGGVDSAYLLYAAVKYAKRTTAYFIKMQFCPEFELNDAKKLAGELNVDFKIIETDVLQNKQICMNDKKRCYYCKKLIMETIKEEAKKDGYDVVLDGTNASDDIGDRPGMRALNELRILSPLKICGLTKDKIRLLSKEANLFTESKPAYACLATRIPSGVYIDNALLVKTEKAEEYLHSLGFSDFRIRYYNKNAKIELKENQFSLLMEKRKDILDTLKQYYEGVFLDLEGRDER